MLRRLTTLHIVLCSGLMSLAAEVEDQLPSAPQGKSWKLIWQDEFEGTTLDASKWDTPEYQRRDGYWSRKAISLDGNGNLKVPVDYRQIYTELLGNWMGTDPAAVIPHASDFTPLALVA